MSLIDRISDLAIAIANDIKGLNTTVNSFDGRLISTEGDVSGINDRVAVLEGLHEDGGGLTMTQVREELLHWGIFRDEYAGEGWHKDEEGRVYCKGVPSGETYQFVDDPNTYISVHDKDLNEGLYVFMNYMEYVAATSNLTKLSDVYEEYGGLYRGVLANRTKDNDVSSWDVAHIEDFTSAFEGVTRLKGLDKLTVSNIVNAESMFAGVYLDTGETVDLSKWYTSKLTNTKNMFGTSKAEPYPSINLNKFSNIGSIDTSNVTDMSYMFYGVLDGHALDLSGFNVKNVDTFEGMFASDYSYSLINVIGLDNWRIKDGADLTNMLSGAVFDFSGNDLSSWCVSHLSSEPDNFANSTLPTYKKPVWGTCPYNGYGWYKDESGVVYCNEVPEGETHQFAGDPIEYVSVYSSIDAQRDPERAATSNITNFISLFYYDTGISDLDISHWDVSNGVDFSFAFGNSDFNNDSILNWNTKNAEIMDYFGSDNQMFDQDLSGWCVPKIATKPSIFLGSSPIENDTSKHPVWGTCPRGEDKK